MLRYPTRLIDSRLLGRLPYHLDEVYASELAALPRGSRVLEVGCGGGQVRRWAEARGLEYLGIDVSADRVHGWLQDHGGPDVLADVHFLPFADESFDAVLSIAVTEHLASPIRAMSEIRRVLRPSGYYFGNTSFCEPWHDASFFHASPLGALSMLESSGFDTDYLWPSDGYTIYDAGYEVGNTITRKLKLLGRLNAMGYVTTTHVRNIVQKVRGKPGVDWIRERARVAGAINWIARR